MVSLAYLASPLEIIILNISRILLYLIQISPYDFALSISQYTFLTDDQKLMREEAYLIAKKRTIEKEIIRLMQVFLKYWNLIERLLLVK